MDQKKHIAIIYPAGPIQLESNLISERISEFENTGFKVTNLKSDFESKDKCTASTILERATQLSFALTSRKFPIIYAARGGVGTTELIPYLENMLPPVIDNKILIGFSDISFLGNYLSIRYPNLTYIHAQNFFAKDLFSKNIMNLNIILNILEEKTSKQEFPININFNNFKNIEGVCIPINLSLAESLTACRHVVLPLKNILFIEEINEFPYTIIRKLDSLINSNFLSNTAAIVLGQFSSNKKEENLIENRKYLCDLFERKTGLPIIDLPAFGHENFCFPLVANSLVQISKKLIIISNKLKNVTLVSTNFTSLLYKKLNTTVEKTKIHFTGIGGTGMAQVAGLFKETGFQISGSDNTIYPPMDKIISKLNINPDVGFRSDNIVKNNPDVVVLANMISRMSSDLKRNPELDKILNSNCPLLSFPSALRKYFLHSSRNIVISGTHGKTTTSSMVAVALQELGHNPSFLIGGSPSNFHTGFALNSPNLFVLEGDEYDSALFDKGPKFLHYEPSITLINNIEFDHADIYDNIQAIESEFEKLAKLTFERNGYIIANLDDERILKILHAHKTPQWKIIGFSSKNENSLNIPCWRLDNFKTTPQGTIITGKSPYGDAFEVSTQVFGKHNAFNVIATFAILHANLLIDKKTLDLQFIQNACHAFKNFKGVKRRFELLYQKNNISVFDDFAHHPTAVTSTIQAFKDYIKCTNENGRLVICFDPKNATLRRNIFQNDLMTSFSNADVIYLGKIHVDKRIPEKEILNGQAVINGLGNKGMYFDDNENLLNTLLKNTKNGDTIVFMSSGSFDGIPYEFVNQLSKI